MSWSLPVLVVEPFSKKAQLPRAMEHLIPSAVAALQKPDLSPEDVSLAVGASDLGDVLSLGVQEPLLADLIQPRLEAAVSAAATIRDAGSERVEAATRVVQLRPPLQWCYGGRGC